MKCKELDETSQKRKCKKMIGTKYIISGQFRVTWIQPKMTCFFGLILVRPESEKFQPGLVLYGLNWCRVVESGGRHPYIKCIIVSIIKIYFENKVEHFYQVHIECTPLEVISLIDCIKYIDHKLKEKKIINNIVGWK